MTRTVTTATPVSAVFDYLADFTNAERWDPNAVRVTRLSGNGNGNGDRGGVEVGTEYRVVSRFAGRTTELDYRVVDLEPGTMIRLCGQKRAVTAVDTIRVAEDTRGTVVSYSVEFTFRGVFAVLAPLLRPAVRRLLEQGAVGLSAELDALR